MSKLINVLAVIANGGTASAEVKRPEGGYDLVGIHAPVCTGTALTLTNAPTSAAAGGTQVAVANAANSAISHTISGTAHYIALDPLLYQGLQFFKLVSGSAEGAERTFNLVFKKQPT